MEANLEPLRKLLRQVQEQLGSPILLARLGNALRELDPAFSPGSYGALMLSDLLGRFPDVGRVDGVGPGKMFVFESSEAAARGPARLQPHIWRAVTDFKTDAGSWHMDLETFQLRHSARDPENLLQTDGERFVALPKLGTDFQKDLARGFVQERLPAQLEAVEAALAAQDWTAALLLILEAEGIADRWKVHRSSRVTEEVLKWGKQHGIPRDRLVEPPGSFIPGARRIAVSTGAGMSEDLADMRALIHDAIEMMSLPELAALPIPPAYLALAASRRRR